MKMFILFLLVLSVTAMAGVNRKMKSSVIFQGIGKFSSSEQIQLSGIKKYTDSESEFDSDDIIKGTAANLILSPGKTGEIIDLNNLQIIKLDHEDEEYAIEEIKKMASDDGNMEQATEIQDESADEEEAEQEEKFRIIRSEFKVTDTGEKKNINSFNCQKFTVLWLTEWEDLENGTRGTDSLYSVVWTTPVTSVITQAQQEEEDFSQAYLSAVGFDFNATKSMILGTNWMSVLSGMSGEGTGSKNEGPEMAGEMAKITGYPILVDGKYFSIRPDDEEQVEEEEEEGGGGLFGALTKQVLETSTSKSKSPEPVLGWYTEVVSISIENIPEDVFQIPSGYEPE